jgi:dihydropteroate synthase
VLPVVEALAAPLASLGVALSVDTTKAVVADAALEAGAVLVNDVSAATFDEQMLSAVAARDAGIVLMHMQGEPRTMQRDPRYEDVVKEVAAFLLERARAAEAAGVPRACLAIDPGIGFGKTTEHNLELLRHLDEIKRLGYPVLVGASRKAFLGKLTAAGGEAPGPQDRLEATLAAHALAAANGADVIRAHDVREHRRALAVVDAWIGSR